MLSPGFTSLYPVRVIFFSSVTWKFSADEYFQGNENDDLYVLVVIALVEDMIMLIMIDHHLNVFLVVLPLVKSPC